MRPFEQTSPAHRQCLLETAPGCCAEHRLVAILSTSPAPAILPHSCLSLSQPSVCWPLRKLTKEKHQLGCGPLIAGLGCRGRGKCMCRAATRCSQPVQLGSAPCTPSHAYLSKGQHTSSLWSMFSTLSKCYGNSLLDCLGSY